MNIEMLCEAVGKVRNGSCVRIGYTTQVPVKAKYRDSIVIKKWVTTTGRLGVKYNNISRVKERLAAQEAKPYKATNFTWVIPNKVKYNSAKDAYYLTIATFPKGSHTRSLYEVIKEGKSTLVYNKDELSLYKDYIIPSYFKDSGCKELDTFIVNADNVFQVGSVTLL